MAMTSQSLGLAVLSMYCWAYFDLWVFCCHMHSLLRGIEGEKEDERLWLGWICEVPGVVKLLRVVWQQVCTRVCLPS